ncbi:mechanosensitive ion channel [Parerythrobacter aestuarii]|uniref:mechanosensitive ion channel n=1 Tax=Parerythrobacter aestuarii TaxID=3020909 RepID=UPI0024DE7A03|nr:mechanosensitive ion channel [Parerythrobacter aestuarii]
MLERFDQDKAATLAVDVGYALVILIVTWGLAKGAKWAFAKLVDAVPLLQKDTAAGHSIGEAIGKIVSLLIWLFGLIAILNVFHLGAVAGPIDELLNNIMDFVPNLVGAGLIFFIGAMVAGIVRDIVTTTLQTVDFDKWANKGGVDAVTGNSTISKTIGTVVYVLIIIPVAILALEALNLESVSQPASNMLQLIFDAIPRIIGAGVLMGLGYLISKFAMETLRELMEGLGVDRSLDAAGILPEGTQASTVIARIVQVAIILTIGIAATRLLGFPELTNILNEVLGLGGRVVFGAAVIGAGFLIANLLARLVGGAEGGSTAATIVRWITIVLFVIMGLQYTGIGGMLPGNALLVIIAGLAVAFALAFGLGGRDWAAKKLDEWDSKK